MDLTLVEKKMTQGESRSFHCEKILIFSTGGTIEKTYDEFDGSLINRESQIKDLIISRLRLPHTLFEVVSIINKDSLYITERERAVVVEKIKQSLKKDLPIVVLHGTDTMTKTAQLCTEVLPCPSAPVVFTGAMRPMGFADSDAIQNVTEALTAAKILNPGIYISFHNQIFNVPGVKKNPHKRTFEAE